MPDPTAIPDEEVWSGAQRLTIGPPVGFPKDGPIRSVEALVDEGPTGRRYSTRWVFNDEEILRLSLGDPLYLVVNAFQMPPVSLGFLEAYPPEGDT